MKKVLLSIALLFVLFGLVACATTTTTTKETTTKDEPKSSETDKQTNAPTDAPTDKSSDSVTTEVEYTSYEDWLAADVDTLHTMVCYVQDKQSWWKNKATLYLLSEDGLGLFAYNAVCSEEDYAKLTEGTQIIVTGYKAEWAGEVEFAEGATFVFGDPDSKCVSGYIDINRELGTEELITYQNSRVLLSNLTVVASTYTDAEGAEQEAAWLYRHDNSGQEGDDLYYKVTDGKNVYTLTVESYLRGKDTDVYKAVKELEIGDVVDSYGYAYWYNGLNPHITEVYNVTKMHEAWVNAEEDTEFTMTLYVQDKQSWWDNKATLYLADSLGNGYLAYNAACDETTYNCLDEGIKIIITGYKTSWSGEVEFAAGATFEYDYFTYYVSEYVDGTNLLGTDELINYQNAKLEFKSLQVVASTYKDAEEQTQEAAWLYKHDNSGQEGDDLYFNVTDGTNTYTFTVESYLRDKDSDVYKAVKELKVGDYIDVKCFAYWYKGLNPHVVEVTVLK